MGVIRNQLPVLIVAQCRRLNRQLDMTYSSQSAYKQKILNDFNNRPNYENEFHRRASKCLVTLAKIQPGQTVLDIATGTGLAAIAAAQIVGSTGHVKGTDFSLGMLQQARQKVAALALTNIEFESVDADEQELLDNQFDVILCSSAIVYLTDIPKALRRWHNALKPGGMVVFSCLAESSPTGSVLFRAVVQRYGITIPNPNELLGTHQKCNQILESVGFKEIKITTEQFGFYSKNVEADWSGNAHSAFGLQEVQWSEQQWEQCKQEYFTEMKVASTELGFWNDITMFFVAGYKG